MNLNLENLKDGDEVVVIFLNPKRTRDGLKYSGPKKAVLDEKGNLRTMTKTGDIIPKDGKGYFFMSERISPDYYFSANPAHIKAAKRQNKRAANIREKKESLLAEKRKIICNFCESYRDNEECYSFEYVPPETLERLTVEQLETLASWLK